MKLLLAVALAFAASTTFACNTIVLPIARVIDGDTIATSLPLPAPLSKVEIRIKGIDTPESTYRAKCALEKERGKAATAAVIQLVGTSTSMLVTNYDWDKYGGRIDGDIHIGTVSIADELIKRGLAKPYTGEGPKPDWCTP